MKTNCGYRLRESRVILYPGKSQRSVTVSSWLDSGVDMDFEFWRKKKVSRNKDPWAPFIWCDVTRNHTLPRLRFSNIPHLMEIRSMVSESNLDPGSRWKCCCPLGDAAPPPHPPARPRPCRPPGCRHWIGKLCSSSFQVSMRNVLESTPWPFQGLRGAVGSRLPHICFLLL